MQLKTHTKIEKCCGVDDPRGPAQDAGRCNLSEEEACEAIYQYQRQTIEHTG